MSSGKSRATSPFSYILLILMGAVLIYLGMNFFRQVHLSYQRREELWRLEQEIESVRQQKAELEARLDYLTTGTAVREWALQNAMARPDEVLVVVVAPPTSPTPGVDGGKREERGTDSPREAWWNLFFGRR